MSNRRHFPVQNSYHVRFRGVKDEIVNLVIPMHKCTPIVRLCPGVSKKGHHLIVVRYGTHGFARIEIGGLCLRDTQGSKGFELAIVEVVVFSKVFHVHASWRDAVEFGESRHCALPHGVAVGGGYVGEGGIGEDAAVEEAHDVEGCAHDAVIFAEADGFGDGNVGVL